MPRIEPVNPNHVDANTAKTLAAVENKLGVLPNLFTTLAHAPAALVAYLQFNETLATGRLTAKQRELIAIAVAQENSCEYCLSAHVAIGKSVGLEQVGIKQAREGYANDPRDDAILAFALQVVRSRGAVSDTDLAVFRDAVGNDGLAIEIVANVALNILTNYVNRVAQTDVDFPLTRLEPAA